MPNASRWLPLSSILVSLAWPASAGAQIEVVSGTYGASCGAGKGNTTSQLARACDGKARCDYVVDHAVLGDPARGCSKDYVAEWKCPGEGKARRARVAPEAGFRRTVVLECPPTKATGAGAAAPTGARERKALFGLLESAEKALGGGSAHVTGALRELAGEAEQEAAPKRATPPAPTAVPAVATRAAPRGDAPAQAAAPRTATAPPAPQAPRAEVPRPVSSGAVPFTDSQGIPSDALARSTYGGEAALVLQGLTRLSGDGPEATGKLASAWAPHFVTPTEATREELSRLLPAVTELVALQSAMAIAAGAFDAAWEEAVAAAAIGSEEGTRQALAMAASHKAELESQQSRVVEIARKVRAAGPIRDPVKDSARIRAEHRAHVRTASVVAGVAPAAATAGPAAGGGCFQLVSSEKVFSNASAQVNGTSSFQGDPPSSFVNAAAWDVPCAVEGGCKGSYRVEATWSVPKVLRPGTPTELSMSGSGSGTAGGVEAGFLLTVHVASGIDRDDVRGRPLRLPVVNEFGWGWNDQVLGVRIGVKGAPDQRSDRFAYTVPDPDALAAQLRAKGAASWSTPMRDRKLHSLLTMCGGGSAATPASVPVKTRTVEGRSAGKLPSTVVAISVRWLTHCSEHVLARYNYEWTPRCNDPGAAVAAPAAEEPDTPTERQKKQRIAEIDANLRIIQASLERDQQDLDRETDASRRASLEFRILQSRSDLLHEQDLKASIQSGRMVHTRSPFDDYAHDTFVQDIQSNIQAMERFQRMSDGVQRLAAMLPPGEAEEARRFIARQIGSKERANLDVARVRKVGDALGLKVQGYAERERARNEEEDARQSTYLEAAESIKRQADAGMAVCSLVGGPWVSLAYSAGTAYVESGPEDALLRVASGLSQPVAMAVTALQGYQEGGFSGAAQGVAIEFVKGKAISYGVGKAMRVAGKAGLVQAPAAQELARFQKARDVGIARAKDFQKANAEAYRLSLAAKRGDAGAARQLASLEKELESKAAAIQEDMHAKSYLKYKADFLTQRGFNRSIAQVHAQVEKEFHEAMQKGKNWSPTPLRPIRNAASAGTVGMDYDVALDESAVGALRRDGKPASLFEWQKDAQAAWNASYRKVTGRSAERSWETVTTSMHPEAYKDLVILGQDKRGVSKLWAQQTADVTRFKSWHLSKDPDLSRMEKLQETSRGTAKDLGTKLLPLLGQAKPVNGASKEAMASAARHWTKVNSILEAFGKGDVDPVYASRRIREVTGGKSIEEVVEQSSTLLESLIRTSGAAASPWRPRKR